MLARRTAVVAAAVAAAVACAAPLSAGKTPSFSLRQASAQFDEVIEQESPDWNYPSNQYNLWRCTHADDGTEHPDNCVHHAPGTPCFWDADDHASWFMDGNRSTLSAGEQYALTLCVVGNDPAYATWAQFFGLALVSSEPRLDVSITISPDGLPGAFTHILRPVRIGNQYEYRGCLGGPVYETGGSVPIPGTNGGTGVRSTVTLQVRNPTSRAARFDSGGALVGQGDYHFQSSSGGFRHGGGYIYFCRNDNPMTVERPLAPNAWEPVYYHDDQ